MTDLDQKPRLGEMSFRFIGKSLVRKEGARLIIGRGRFSDDFSVDGQACAVMLRSPHAHEGLTDEAEAHFPGARFLVEVGHRGRRLSAFLH